jgi:hypothetical protein
MLTVFDCVARTDTTRKKRSEGLFAYWNRSARPGTNASRELIEDWFSRVPAAEQAELRSRFRRDVEMDCSPFQELCLHEFLLRQNCALSFHPALSGTDKRPDYRVLQPNGTDFILEARSSSAISTGPQINTRRNRIRDWLQDFKLPGFSIGIGELTAGSRDIPRRSIERHIREEAEKNSTNDSSFFPIRPFETADGWRLRLDLIRSLGNADSGEVRYESWSRVGISPSFALLAALRKKGGRYGDELDLPFVIALNSSDSMSGDRVFDQTLFGESQTSNSPRSSSGFWGTAEDPVYRRVSAVLFTANLWPETILTGQVWACLYLNPWAHRPYHGVLTKLDTVKYENGVLRRDPGTPIHRLLGSELLDSSLWK